MIIILVIGSVLAPKGSISATEDPISAARILKLKDGIGAPDFSIEDLEGNRVNLKDFRGRVVLLDFWATW